MQSAESRPTIVANVPRMPERPADMHKGQAGHVAIIAGSRGMSGAACLAGLAALRGGAGLVRVYSPESVQPIVAASEPSLMTVPLEETVAGDLMAAPAMLWLHLGRDWPHAVAVGPGLGQSDALRELLIGAPGAAKPGLLGTFEKPMVIDADGLNNLANLGPKARWWESRTDRPTVITPHPGEMARLRSGAGLAELRGSDDQTRLRIAHEFASLSETVVVLKGHRTVVCTIDRAYINTTGNPGMATGGMGDVLTGLIAALLAQGLSAFDAACLGVHAHGRAADLLAKQIGPAGYLAREVADLLPAALAEASRTPMGFKST
jgi:ADP-dependent NAD(P)H-hydrate dehydratase